MKNLTAIIEGKSGKIYLSEAVKTMKEGLMKINDFANENAIPENHARYFKTEEGKEISVSQYLSDLEPPVDTETEKDLGDFRKHTTGQSVYVGGKWYFEKGN